MTIFRATLIVVLALLFVPDGASAGGPYGAPEPVVKKAAGIHTGIGYWFQEERYGNGTEQIARQNQVYSELGYGSMNGWEITARVGMSDMKMGDAFRSSAVLTSTDRDDFRGAGKIFSTLGAKVFYPCSKTIGFGVFARGAYYFRDFADDVSGTRSGAPFAVELGVKNFWELDFGMGLQATIPEGIKIYIGPYLRRAEFRISPSAAVAGIAHTSMETSWKNSTGFGGFSGIEMPLAKGFRLNMEAQYAERLSIGAAVLYAY